MEEPERLLSPHQLRGMAALLAAARTKVLLLVLVKVVVVARPQMRVVVQAVQVQVARLARLTHLQLQEFRQATVLVDRVLLVERVTVVAVAVRGEMAARLTLANLLRLEWSSLR